jgi:succinate dehydrogenase hydrophobic anchor subunit
MNFFIELFAELSGWIGLGQAKEDFEKGKRKRAMVLLILFLIMLAGILVYIIYGIVRFFKTY